MKKILKKTTLALLITNAFSLFAYASTTVNIDGSFSITDMNESILYNSNNTKTKVNTLLSDKNLNQDKLNSSSKTYSGNYFPAGSGVRPIIKNSVLEVINIPLTLTGQIYGGYCRLNLSDCEIKNTNVVINGDNIIAPQNVYGGVSQSTGDGSVYLMNNTQVNFDVYGFSASPPITSKSKAEITGNVFLMDDSDVGRYIWGASATSASSSSSASVKVTGSVYLMDRAHVGQSVYGASASSSSSDSTTTGDVYLMDKARVEHDVYGASASSPSVITTGNVYLTNNAEVGMNVIGAFSIASNVVSSSSAKVIGNVHLAGDSKVKRDVYGARTSATSPTSSSSVATGNVYLTGNTQVGMNVIGASSSSSFSATATGSVYIYGNVKLQDDTKYNTYLYGGDLNNYAAYYNVFNENLLSIGNAAIKVKSMGNFENYRFYLNNYNQSDISNGTALITVTDSMLNNDTVIDNNTASGSVTTNQSNIEVAGISGEDIVSKGSSITLIDASSANSFTGGNNTGGIDGLFNTPTNNTVNVGLVGKADISYTVDTENNKIIANINDIYSNKESVTRSVKPLAEGRLAAVQNVTRGADLLMGVMNGEKKPVGTFTPIAVIDGGINKYKSGSSVDTHDYRFIVGSQYQFSDNFLMGLTAEYGRSNFDTHNEFSSGDIDGSGHSYNYGVSLFGKLQTASSTDSQMYMDGAVRFGRTSSEFNSSDIITGGGDTAHYKSKVNYWGAILGAGYIYNLNDTSSFDTSIHYLWTRLGSDGVNLDGDTVNFDNSSSSRIQVKEQYGYQHSENIKFTLAGIYEYEMDGDADASVSGIGIDAPSVKGSTGIMEMGIIATPIEGNKDFSLNLNFRGYGGKRQGASAGVMVKYDF